MVLNKPEQDLKRDLQGVTSDLKWSTIEMMRIAERLSLAGNEPDAQAMMRTITIFHSDKDRLDAYADEEGRKDCASPPGVDGATRGLTPPKLSDSTKLCRKLTQNKEVV